MSAIGKLESLGHVLVSGFGDRVLIGVLMSILDDVTPYRCYEYIRDDMELFNWVNEDEGQRYKKMVRQAMAKPGGITKERIIDELRKHRPDLLGVIINHPGGDEWLGRQIDIMKEKLGLE